MTCHVTNQINQHMHERDNDEALTIEALRDERDELRDKVDHFESHHEAAMANWKETLDQRDRLQSTVAALEREKASYAREAEHCKVLEQEARSLADSLARQVEGLKAALSDCLCEMRKVAAVGSGPRNAPFLDPCWIKAYRRGSELITVAALAEPKEVGK